MPDPEAGVTCPKCGHTFNVRVPLEVVADQIPDDAAELRSQIAALTETVNALKESSHAAPEADIEDDGI